VSAPPRGLAVVVADEPGEEAWAVLRDAVADAGLRIVFVHDPAADTSLLVEAACAALQAGSPARAGALLDRACGGSPEALAENAGPGLQPALQALLAGRLGDEPACRTHAVRAFQEGSRLSSEIATAALGELELAHGGHEEALAHFESLTEAVDTLAAPSIVEAAVRAGRHELALITLARFRRTGHSAAQEALVERCLGLLAEGGDAVDHFERAIRLHLEAGRTFDCARTRLLAGEALRRARRRREARTHLRAAAELFVRLGATPWSERARAELRGSGLTAQRGDPSALDRLTPQELQVARLVAAGASNKQVAAQLVLSPRTIDFHLRNIFAKLGITSRMQLAWFTLADEVLAA